MKQKLDDTAGRECPKIGQVPRQMGDMPKGGQTSETRPSQALNETQGKAEMKVGITS